MENVSKYFSRLRELVALELEEEQSAYRRSIDERRNLLGGSICEPECRYPVTIGNADYNALGQLTVELRYETLESEVEIDFEPGKPITFFYLAADSAKEVQHQCYVELVGDGRMVVSLPGKAALQSLHDLAARHLLGVQLGVDSTSFRVMDSALREAERSERERFVRLQRRCRPVRGRS